MKTFISSLLFLMITSITFAQVHQLKVTVSYDSVIYMKGDTLMIDSNYIHYQSINGSTTNSLSSLTAMLSARPVVTYIHDTIYNTIHDTVNNIAYVTKYIHDTLINTVYAAIDSSYKIFKSLFPLWNNKVAFYVSKDYLFSGSLKYRALTPVGNVPGGANVINVGISDAIILPDMSAIY